MGIARKLMGQMFGGLDEMTDTEVHEAVAKAKRRLKAATTRARNVYSKEVKAAREFLRSTDDVTRAALMNSIARSDNDLVWKERDAEKVYEIALDNIRGSAGQWADLVPRVARYW